MQTMLKGILEALCDCHGRNWALCDIRLPYIIVTRRLGAGTSLIASMLRG